MLDRFTFFTRAAVLTTAAIVLTSSIAAAQTPPAAAPETGLLGTAAFARLVGSNGKEVWITTVDGARRKSRIVSLDSSTMTVENNTVRKLTVDQIVKVENVSHRDRNRLMRGAAIGFGSGFGPISVLLLSCWGDECGETLAPAFAFGGIGAGIGVGIAALMNLHGRSDDVIYDATRAARRTTTISLAPILSPTRKGVAFSMTWR